MKVYNLQANHLPHPVGIDGRRIRLTWCLEGGLRQSAYQVEVKTESGDVLECTDKTVSGEMTYTLKEQIPYRSRAEVTVRVWDEQDQEGEAENLRIVTGIEREAWRANWINPELTCDPKVRKPGSYLRRRFSLDAPGTTPEGMPGAMPEITPGRAMLYITSHGICNVYVNGAEATDMQLMPGTTQEDRRLMVETIDVGALLVPGENEMVVTLGDGWHRGAMGYDQNVNVHGTDVALLCQLEVDKEPVVISDEHWEASNDGPLGKNDMMAGEEYDAAREETMTWHEVKVEDFGYDNLICVDTVPMLPQETFEAELITTPKGEKVLDFGQNLVGYVKMDVEAKAGQTITLVHGETLDGDGNFTIENFQNPNPKIRTEQRIVYRCREGRNVYHPTKTYMGFRYVLVEADFDIDPADFTAVAVYSDMRTTAEFSCGVPEVNQLFANALWSMKGNFVDVPTDCPTREKSGYSGDCQAYVHTAMYLMDCYAVYAKWIREQAATQYEDGCVAQVAPKNNRKRQMTDGGIGWCDSFEVVPYHLQKRYGDDTLTADHYEQIAAWMRFQIGKSKKIRLGNRKRVPKQLRPYVLDNGWLWGEWLEPGMDVVAYMKDLVLHGDLEISSAYLSYGCALVASMAEHLGKTEDAAYFREVSEKAKEAYRYLFLPNGKIEEPKRQCRYVRPIALGMLTEEEKQETAAALAKKVAENGGKLNTGFLTTHELCRALTKNGQARTAYDLLLQREAPGWLYSVLQGATTIPENWFSYGADGSRKDSFNHYSYGAIAGWLMDCVCGICLEDGQIEIHPYPDERLGYARASYDSPVGKIVSGWKYTEDRIEFSFTVPANNSARLILPDGEHVVEAGEYTFAFDKTR